MNDDSGTYRGMGRHTTCAVWSGRESRELLGLRENMTQTVINALEPVLLSFIWMTWLKSIVVR